MRWAALAALFALAAHANFRGGGPPRWLAYAAALGAIALAVDRTTFLPFLGEAVLPPSVLRAPESPFAFTDDQTASVVIEAAEIPRGATRVVWWAASRTSNSPKDAYAGFQNAGVEEIVTGEKIIVRLLAAPGQYAIRGAKIRPHVHYRFVLGNGLLGPVVTKAV